MDYFRSLGMPTCLTELGCGLQSEEELKELARRCTFYGARTIGAFRVLGEADILAIYRAANRLSQATSPLFFIHIPAASPPERSDPCEAIYRRPGSGHHQQPVYPV